jgi:hypothetical protein
MLQLEEWWLRPLLCYGEYIHDCKLKKFREMLSTTLEHNQHGGSAGRICHLENVKSYMSYLHEYTKVIMILNIKGKINKIAINGFII